MHMRLHVRHTPRLLKCAADKDCAKGKNSLPYKDAAVSVLDNTNDYRLF